jgi:hypothetical protein
MAQVYDDYIKMETVDLVYIASKQTTIGSIPNKKGLVRCEFLEFLSRLAKAKFLDTGKVKTWTEAFEKLFEEFIKPNVLPKLEPWQQFRDNHLWTLEVNDVLQANLDLIKRLHEHYFEDHKKFMSYKSAHTLLTKNIQNRLTSK